MKTQNTKTGNNNNQVEKVILRSAAVIISFVLISFTVSAQGFWKQLLTNNSFGKVALLMVEESVTADVATERALPAESAGLSFYFEQASDEALEIESWMTDDAYFGAYTNMAVPEVEADLELEEWMKDESYFSNKLTVEEKEKELELEAWMTDASYWRM
ncbi:hypothetical protein [Sunxiuqinia dokdonensis]|uniref:Uncharacterized protein n=1 Tax=Sunxiuqinia dokdonensis TaxID=1409788 RepID=A0A0L8V497_9BACT|nr:hypothetical protein [Sunxiuqinia dokdonensis]KOH43315.1 hypothetical protein NC99_38750 [Sunxiuqinia dokdonensis]